MDNKVYVTRSSMPSMEEYVHEIEPIWDSHWLTNMGPKHDELKNKLNDYLKVDNVELLVNGHMALEMSIQAFDFPKGAEVITTPFTFASTTHAIVRNGLVPVFCDINPGDYTIDTNKIEGLITNRTCAILPVHVYGNICDIESIHNIADKYKLKVIYDAAHAFGETYKGLGVANLGDASIFSFHATKVFNTIEGGAVCYRDAEFGRKLYNLKNFGIRDEETVEAVGANAKMNEFAAAMGVCNLRHIDENICSRKIAYELYSGLLDDCLGITINRINEMTTSNYSYYPILIDSKITGYSRDDLYTYLKAQGIFTRKYFYPLTCDFDCYKNIGSTNNLPVAREISSRVLTLPLYSGLASDDIERICSLIKTYKGN